MCTLKSSQWKFHATDSIQCNATVGTLASPLHRTASFFMSVAQNHHPSFMKELIKHFFTLFYKNIECALDAMFVVLADLWLIFYDVHSVTRWALVVLCVLFWLAPVVIVSRCVCYIMSTCNWAKLIIILHRQETSEIRERKNNSIRQGKVVKAFTENLLFKKNVRYDFEALG